MSGKNIPKFPRRGSAVDIAIALSLVKARLGITSTVRDEYLTAIINGLIKELEDVQGIPLEPDNQCHMMFVVDYAVWRYQSRDESGVMPRHLQFRLHNLFVHEG